MNLRRSGGVIVLVVSVLIVLTSCTNNMSDQARCQPLEANAFFEDQKCARPLPEYTVARRYVQDVDPGALDAVGAQEATAENGFPLPITRELLTVGRQRYDIYCAPCHGLSGYGDGMIVQRGFPAPPSFHTDRLRNVEPAYIVDVIENGFGRMYSYAYRVEPEQRWAIAAYIQALQLSQNATIDDVPPEQREQLQGGS